MRLAKVLFITILIPVFGVLVGCDNTVRGIGQDMQQTGQKIEKSANEH